MIVPTIKSQAAEPIKKETIEQAEEKPAKEETKQSSGTIKATITHYCACSSCNGKWSYTENGLNCTKTASGIVLYDGISGNYCAATFGSLGDVIRIKA